MFSTLTFIFLLFRGRPEPLPRQSPSHEVHKYVTQRLHVVPATLLNTQVGIDGGVASGTSQVLVFPVGDVLVGAGVAILFCQPEVDDVDEITLLAETPAKKITIRLERQKV